MQEFSVKPYATPAKLESIDGENTHFILICNFCCRCVDSANVMLWWPLAGARYQALLLPDCPGALHDLAHSGSLHRILTHFISQQSECDAHITLLSTYCCLKPAVLPSAEPVCAVGQGVSALCCATEGQTWIFSGYSLTGVSSLYAKIKKTLNQISWCSMYCSWLCSHQCVSWCGGLTLPTCPWL